MTIPVHRVAAVCAAALAALSAGRVFAQADDLPEGPGKADVATTCSQCHATTVISARHRAPEEWVDVVGRMKSMGAVMDADKEKSIIAYLSTALGTGTAPAAAPAAAPTDPAAPPPTPAPPPPATPQK
ncbi:cytochrome c [Phenylobacterium sp.]|uniref:c-type cytochrome n=1 Tax=Phenylobacterium sp. TaxID=1871053 RepID=UPI002DEF6950|nr:cytochrome c [Phenylobacterium sp.]